MDLEEDVSNTESLPYVLRDSVLDSEDGEEDGLAEEEEEEYTVEDIKGKDIADNGIDSNTEDVLLMLDRPTVTDTELERFAE